MEDLIRFPTTIAPKENKKLKRAQSLVGSSPGKEEYEFYPTPPDATQALLRVEDFQGSILEPACGNGAISKVLIDAGYTVISTDLIDRGFGSQADYLDFDYKETADNIITNPPFTLAERFIELSLQRSQNKVAMLLKVQFLEGIKRKKLFETTPLKKVWVFSKRLKMARNGETEKYSSGMMCFAWYVWDKKFKREPTIGWL